MMTGRHETMLGHELFMYNVYGWGFFAIGANMLDLHGIAALKIECAGGNLVLGQPCFMHPKPFETVIGNAQ